MVDERGYPWPRMEKPGYWVSEDMSDEEIEMRMKHMLSPGIKIEETDGFKRMPPEFDEEELKKLKNKDTFEKLRDGQYGLMGERGWENMADYFKEQVRLGTMIFDGKIPIEERYNIAEKARKVYDHRDSWIVSKNNNVSGG